MTCHAGAGSRKAGHVLVTAGSRAGASAQVYHTARMQRVFAARFSGDGAYVFSGSDDMNVRVWKVRAHRVSPALRIPLEWGACAVRTLLRRGEPAGLLCQLAASRMLRSSSLFLFGVLPYQGMPVSHSAWQLCTYPGLQREVSRLTWRVRWRRRRRRARNRARCCRASGTRRRTRRRSCSASGTCRRSSASSATATCPPRSTRRAPEGLGAEA